MYTEVKEIVNFISKYLLGRVPRRPTGIFAAELGNFLIRKFGESHWDVNNPKLDENVRMIEIKCSNETSKVIITAAEEAGIDVNEMLHLLPANLRLFGNPGNVYYRAAESAVAVPIWSGRVDADKDYQPMPEWAINCVVRDAERSLSNLGAAGKTVYVGQLKSPIVDKAVNELISGWYVPLGLEDNVELNSNLHASRTELRKRFVFKPHSSQTYTAREFSQTRFGSSKIRPDVDAMMSLKQMAAARNMTSHESDSRSHADASSLSSSPIDEDKVIYEDERNDTDYDQANQDIFMGKDEKRRFWADNWNAGC
ncbi:unnamed protein product [Caenorhabditis auriculariae]|uniref:Anti-proliferative protein domain-containing protein n=1 Tax=Caenorhabditis auriculariae TaxID=2777116 RepID=A0A8S1GM84_9PELO|nr:unnamed protein product [Caenorhabditis auriculariae]